ncbi:MAG TPA: glycine cleavage system protein GcvH [Armatimonadetes bacterium]|nr:glycine cleavage system protein GcvH [Armatimonadota bacterium]
MSSGEMMFDESHMWVRLEDEDTAITGLSDYAQDMLGEVIFVELPEEGAALVRGDACGTVESVKSVEDLISPISGEVVRVNEEVLDSPELINQDPHGDGWLMEVKLEDPSELSSLMSDDDYERHLDNLEGDLDEDDEDF